MHSEFMVIQNFVAYKTCRWEEKKNNIVNFHEPLANNCDKIIFIFVSL